MLSIAFFLTSTAASADETACMMELIECSNDQECTDITSRVTFMAIVNGGVGDACKDSTYSLCEADYACEETGNYECEALYKCLAQNADVPNIPCYEESKNCDADPSCSQILNSPAGFTEQECDANVLCKAWQDCDYAQNGGSVGELPGSVGELPGSMGGSMGGSNGNDDDACLLEMLDCANNQECETLAAGTTFAEVQAHGGSANTACQNSGNAECEAFFQCLVQNGIEPTCVDEYNACEADPSCWQIVSNPFSVDVCLANVLCKAWHECGDESQSLNPSSTPNLPTVPSYGFSFDSEGNLRYENGYVCDIGFDRYAGQMVCATMGLSYVSFTGGIQLPSSDFSMDEITCWSGASRLADCSYNSWRGCLNSEGVRLICGAPGVPAPAPGVPAPAEPDRWARAPVGGSGGFSFDSEGNLRYEDGYVCDDLFNEHAGRMVCATMGLGYVSYLAESQLPSDDFSMDELTCGSGAYTLADCSYRTSHDCLSWEGVRLICGGMPSPRGSAGMPSPMGPPGWAPAPEASGPTRAPTENNCASHSTCVHCLRDMNCVYNTATTKCLWVLDASPSSDIVWDECPANTWSKESIQESTKTAPVGLYIGLAIGGLCLFGCITTCICVACCGGSLVCVTKLCGDKSSTACPSDAETPYYIKEASDSSAEITVENP